MYNIVHKCLKFGKFRGKKALNERAKPFFFKDFVVKAEIVFDRIVF